MQLGMGRSVGTAHRKYDYEWVDPTDPPRKTTFAGDLANVLVTMAQTRVPAVPLVV